MHLNSWTDTYCFCISIMCSSVRSSYRCYNRKAWTHFRIWHFLEIKNSINKICLILFNSDDRFVLLYILLYWINFPNKNISNLFSGQIRSSLLTVRCYSPHTCCNCLADVVFVKFYTNHWILSFVQSLKVIKTLSKCYQNGRGRHS